jgi:hypothetical protein
MRWFALRHSGWWEYLLQSEPGYEELAGVNEDARMLWAGLAPSLYERAIEDDAFASAAVDVIARIIGDEPGFESLLERLGLADLATVTANGTVAGPRGQLVMGRANSGL